MGICISQMIFFFTNDMAIRYVSYNGIYANQNNKKSVIHSKDVASWLK